MTKVLIENSTRVRKLLGPPGMGAVGTTELGSVGTAGLAAALNFRHVCDYVAKATCKVNKGMY